MEHHSIIQKMNDCSSQYNLFFTEKHSNHDEIWMLKNSVLNAVCFACSVETLDDGTALNVRKRKAVANILDLLTTNRSIWDIFAKQKATLCRTGNVLLKLLSSKDEQLTTLVVEGLGILVQRSKEEYGANLMDSLVAVINKIRNGGTQESLEPYFSFLGKAFRNSDSMIQRFLSRYSWVMEMIVENSCKLPERHVISCWYIMALIYKSDQSKKVSIKLSKVVLEKIVHTILHSVSKELQLNVLAVLKSFVTSEILCKLIVELDEKGPSTSHNCIANMMKKLMLSTNKDVQIVALQCLSEILTFSSVHAYDVDASLQQRLLSHGLCEFLFELLNFSEHLLTASTLNCLLHFAACKTFFTAGHVIYGIEPILKSITDAVEAADMLLLEATLQLLLRILQNSRDCSALIEKHLTRILKIMNELSETRNANILHFVVACTSEAMRAAPRNDIEFTMVKRLILNSGTFLSTVACSESRKSSVDPVVLSLLKGTLHLVRCTIELFFDSSSQSDEENYNEGSNVVQHNSKKRASSLPRHLVEFQYIADVHLIPATMMLLSWLKDQRTFLFFFDILACLIENDQDTAFAKKLCESSFVRIAVEVKASLKEKETKEIGSVIDKFLVSLVCKLDDSSNERELKASLQDIIPLLHAPPSEWHLLFFKTSSTNDFDVKCVYPVTSSCISLLYITTRFGAPLWKNEIALRSLPNFISKDNFKNLPVSLKRHAIYLWAHARANSKSKETCHLFVEKEIFTVIEHEAEPADLFVRDECFIRWIFHFATNQEIKLWVLSDLFLLDERSMKLEEIIQVLKIYKNDRDFYAGCVQILAFGTSCAVSQALHVVCLLTAEDCNLEIIVQIKEMVNRLILSHGPEVDQFNLVSLLNLCQHLSASTGATISDVDLKLANRLCSLFGDCPYFDIRIATLNYLNQVLFHMQKSGNLSNIAVMCNEHFLKEVVNIIPRQLEFTGKQSERICAACLVFISQLVAVVSAQKIKTTLIQPFKVDKMILIATLSNPQSVLVQMAGIYFWNNFLSLSQPQSYMLQSEDVPLYVHEEDLKTILILQQNLLFYKELRVQELSLKGMNLVIRRLHELDTKFKNPWSTFLFEYCLENINLNINQEFNMKMITFLLNNGTKIRRMESLTSSVFAIIKSRKEVSETKRIDITLLRLIRILVGSVQLSAQQCNEVKVYLHILENNAKGFGEEPFRNAETYESAFAAVDEVLFPIQSRHQNTLENYIVEINECNEKLTRNMLR